MNQVAQRKTTQVVASELDKMLEADAGVGLENITTEDMQIPFIRIIQALSPQLQKDDPLYIKGAEQGDIFNTVSQEIYKQDEGVIVVPAFFEKKFLEFQLRSSGGGFVRELAADDKDITMTSREGTIELLPNGNELVRTHQHLVIAQSADGTIAPSVLDMKKTQLKVSRRWNTLKNSARLPSGALMPIYGTAWQVTTVLEANDQGKWFNYKLDRVNDITPAIEKMMLEARNMYQGVSKGEVKMAAASADEIAKEEDVPF
jgi:hypothetical protein|tara:strand:+ start:483 stop:1259 length:777 start_codon:yes stop_codon:yes gene_type:complete